MEWDHGNRFQDDKALENMKLENMKAVGEAVGKPPSRRGRSVFACPGCGAHTYGGMAHCTKCGCALSRKCPTCGAQWRYEYSYAFCPGCGTQLQLRKEPEGQEPSRSKAPVSGQVGGGA
jgi:predicted RNA-binding Zn-ribbon protein involved in translation (DUF1610 family)